MVILQILLASFVGTTIMTVFSYLVSIAAGKQFREPVLLNKLLDRWVNMHITPHRSNPMGWLLHYLVGVAFVLAYHLVWVYTAIGPSWYSAVVMGAISGIAGIGIWYVTFLMHSKPPKVHLFGFFSQLFFAHIFFGFGAWIGYMLPLWWS